MRAYTGYVDLEGFSTFWRGRLEVVILKVRGGYSYPNDRWSLFLLSF